MSMMRRLEFLPDKFEQRVKPFTGIVSDFKLETLDSGATLIILEFGEDEAPLKINLGYPEKWVETNGGMTPKPGSTIYKFLTSFYKVGVEVLINDDLTEIKSEPSIIGKTCSFDVQAKSFNSPTEVDEAGQPKSIMFYIWTLVKVVDSTVQAAQPKNVTYANPATAPAAPSPVLAPADIERIKRNWIEIISNIPDEKFQYPMLIKTRGMWVSGKTFDESERQYYNNIDRVKEIMAILETEGYISKVGPEFQKNTDAIFLALV